MIFRSLHVFTEEDVYLDAICKGKGWGIFVLDLNALGGFLELVWEGFGRGRKIDVE